MIKNNLNIGEIISEGWDKTKKNFWFLFCLMVTSVILMAITQYSEILDFILGIPLGIATLTIALVIVGGHTPKYEDLFKSFKNYKITLNFFITSILCIMIIVLGFVFFIIPGIYLAVRLQFYKFLVIENENMSPVGIIKESYKMTEGYFWKLFGFIVVMVVINLIGAIPLGLGLIFTVPLTLISGAVFYKKLKPHHIHIV